MAFEIPIFEEPDESEAAPPFEAPIFEAPTFEAPGQTAAVNEPFAAPLPGETVDTTLDSEGKPSLLTALSRISSARPKLTSPDPATQPEAVDLLETSKHNIINLGQKLQEYGRRPETRNIAVVPGLSMQQSGKLLEETARLGSSVIEQIGTVYSDLTNTDQEYNPLYQVGRTLREATRTPDDVIAEENLPEQFERGLLQTLGFFAGGAVAKSPKMVSAVAAWLGSAVGGQAGREDAVRHGAEEWQNDVAYYSGAAFGLTEGLPISLALNRIDGMTGGVISSKIKNAGLRTTARLTKAGIKGLIEEGLQEAVQTLGENWTAADLAEYDPTRSLVENIDHAVTVGGGVGAIISMTMASFGIRNRAKFEKRLKDEVLTPLGVEKLDDIAIHSETGKAHFSVLSDEYLGLMKGIGQAKDIIKKRAEDGKVPDEEWDGLAKAADFFADESADRGETLDPDALPLEEESRALNQHYDFAGQVGLSPVNKEVEGVEATISERLQKTPVVSALTNLISFNENLIKQGERQIENDKNNPELSEEVRKKAAAELQETIEIIKRQNKEIVEVAKNLKNMAAAMRPLMSKDFNIVLTDHLIDKGREDGSYMLLQEGDKKISVINIDLQELASAAARYAKTPGDAERSVLNDAKNEVLQTFYHEMGHLLAYDRFHGLSKKIKEGKATTEETQLWNGLKNDYIKFVAKNINSSTADVFMNLLALPRAQRILRGRYDLTRMADYERVWKVLQGSDYQTIPFLDNVNPNFAEYLFSVPEYFAEEFSKIALGLRTSGVDPAVNAYFKEGVKAMRRMFAKVPGKFQTSSPTMASFWRMHSMRGQLRTAVEEIQKNTEQNPLVALVKSGIVDKQLLHERSQEIDVFNWFMDKGFNILQIAEQNPHLRGLQRYVEHLREWKNEVNNNLAIAQDRITEWKNLGAAENEKLARLLFDETLGRKPDGGYLQNPRPFTQAEIATYELSQEALELRDKIKADFKRTLDQMEQVLVNAKRSIFADNPVEAAKEVAKVQKEFSQMRRRPYFPLMRFGNYIYQVRSVGEQVIDGKKYKDGDVVDFQAFDTKAERDKAFAQSKREYIKSKVNFSRSKMKKPNFSLQGMPLTLLEHLEGKLVSSSISDEVRDALREVKNDVLPFKSFRKQFQRRKRIEGYSMDAMRSYANYMTSFSNHIARVKFDKKFKQDFDEIDASIKAINNTQDGDSTKRSEILNHMNDHLQYVMNPVNEFVGLRSAAFFWFLGFNVKSAFVNLTQIPLVSYPYLAARYGDAKAVGQLTRANKTAIHVLTRPKSVDPDIRKLVEQGMAESWLDESLATELALAASEKNLDKSLPRKMRQKTALKLSQWGSYAFHKVEKFNRHVTAIAAYRLARADGRNHDVAVKAARNAVEKSQFEYARWARPKFMQGKLGGTVFVFQNYLQNALYFALGGDAGAFRMLLMLFMVAGLQGLPFGENLADLIDAAMTSYKKRTGTESPHTQIRVELRKLIMDLDMNPDLILHGLSSQTFGLSQIGEFMGWPIPDIDLSGSLSLGRVLPLTEMLQPGQTNTFERVTSQGLERGGGAIVSAVAGVGKAFMDSHPDQWKRWEKAMPAAMRQISKAARYKVRGEEATRSGYPIAGFDMHDPRDQAELIAQALGFTPRDVSKGWEGFIAEQQAVIYYETWKTSLLRQWNYAKEKGDEEGIKQTNADIREYNSIVPFPEMKIGFETRRSSFKTYIRTRRFNEQKMDQSRATRRLADSIQAVFEEGEEEN